MALPKFADGEALAGDLERDPRFELLAEIIRRAALEQSCASDLSQAQSCCDALEWLLASPRKRGTMERSATENALLMTAITLYARATATVGKRGERGSVNIRARLAKVDPALATDHDTIVAIRNRAFAHVYPNEAVGGDVWHEERPFLVDQGAGWLPAGAKRSIQFHKPTFERLLRLLPCAQRLMIEKYHKSTNRMTELYNANPIPTALLEKHLVDPVEFFGSEESVRNALAGIPKGSASGLVL